jgi:sugar-phosphatase
MVSEQSTAPAADLGTLAGRSFGAVLFDLDGTLVDSTPAVERSWRRWGQEYGVPMDSFGSWHGIPAAQIITTLLPADQQSDEQVAAAAARIAELEISDVEGILVLPGAAAALAGVASGRSAIVTSCVADLAAARLGATGLTPPSVLVTADQTPVGKPDPAPFLLGARRLGVDPADCLVVEDAPAGLAAAKAAGCARLAVTTTTPRERLEADAVVPDLSAVRFEVDGMRIRVRPA